MTSTPYDHTITESLQTVAELIALKPKQEWAAWVLFLLAEMKTILPEQGYTDLVAQVQEDLARQLAELAS